MVDAGVVYGLAGALGAALIGAAATIIVPARQHHRRAEELAQAEAASQRAKREEAIQRELDRLSSLREAGREWIEILERSEQSLNMGVAVDLAEFDQAIKEAGGKAARYDYNHWPEHPQYELEVEVAGAAVYDTLTHATGLMRRRVAAQGSSYHYGWDLEPAQALDYAKGIRRQLNQAMREYVTAIRNGEPPAVATSEWPPTWPRPG
ncbi:hypothetical protein AB0L33_30490 [Streptomyces sp. NPDC052299]|uniref:hypothetical protein n=1 Tax=Streptomyces sp. NPDC052299 TaxID=3155054 RepID=UPI00342FC881